MTGERGGTAAADGRGRLPLLWALVVPLGLFALIAGLVVGRRPGRLDRVLFGYLYSGESDWPLGPTPARDNRAVQTVMDQLLRLADDRELIVLTLVVLVVLAAGRRLRGAAFVIGALAIVVAAGPLKALFRRDSPFPLPGDSSFPSGHAMATFALGAAVVVLLAGTRLQLPGAIGAAIIVCAVGLAVVADGGHWVSDILAGWCLAWAWVGLLVLAVHRIGGDETMGAKLRHRSRFGRPRRGEVPPRSA